MTESNTEASDTQKKKELLVLAFNFLTGEIDTVAFKEEALELGVDERWLLDWLWCDHRDESAAFEKFVEHIVVRLGDE